jgi:hypothetical protein
MACVLMTLPLFGASRGFAPRTLLNDACKLCAGRRAGACDALRQHKWRGRHVRLDGAARAWTGTCCNLL